MTRPPLTKADFDAGLLDAMVRKPDPPDPFVVLLSETFVQFIREHPDFPIGPFAPYKPPKAKDRP